MACCDCKQGTGKCLVWVFTIMFGLGVIISTASPNWIAFAADGSVGNEGGDKISNEVEWGPFYGQYRTCTGTTCDAWVTKSFDIDDCSSVGDDLTKLCNHLNAWRSLGILCLCLMLIGGGLVLAASCCQMITCGCCGNSLTCISNVLFGVEVILSIAAWSLAITSLREIKTSPAVTSSGYQWGFWLFIASGTILGALAAWMADWAAEDSCLRGIWHCITCRSCRKGGDGDDDKREPLVQGSSAV